MSIEIFIQRKKRAPPIRELNERGKGEENWHAHFLRSVNDKEYFPHLQFISFLLLLDCFRRLLCAFL